MNIDDFLICPTCKSADLANQGNEILCRNCLVRYPIARGVPVLINDNNSLFSRSDYIETPVHSDLAESADRRRFIPSLSSNHSRNDCLDHLSRLYSQQNISVLVVGAGLQRKKIVTYFSRYTTEKFCFIDIDHGADVTHICDAHDLPFGDSTFDIVITTAVLEHVVDPPRVADEITRVTKVGGYLYSELPFLQSVHEGAYDFTRYTLLGHRRLFSEFEDLASGVLAGPGTVFAWSLEALIRCLLDRVFFTRCALASKLVGRVAAVPFKYLDYLFLDERYADFSSCTYFMGRRQNEMKRDTAILSSYKGMNSFNHV